MTWCTHHVCDAVHAAAHHISCCQVRGGSCPLGKGAQETSVACEHEVAVPPWHMFCTMACCGAVHPAGSSVNVCAGHRAWCHMFCTMASMFLHMPPAMQDMSKGHGGAHQTHRCERSKATARLRQRAQERPLLTRRLLKGSTWAGWPDDVSPEEPGGPPDSLSRCTVGLCVVVL